MKKNKGITMISLVITIIVLLIVTSITIGNGLGQLGIKRVNNLYADIESISTKVAEYYLKNGTLPVYDNLYVNNKQELEELFKKNGATEKITNVNDGDEYYVINPTKLDNLTLNYGDDYKEWTNTSTSEEIQNIFDAPIIYLFNKMDIAEYDGIRHDYIQQYIDKTENPLLISAAEGEGIDEIIKLIMQVEKRERESEEDDEDLEDENYFDLT